MFEDQLQHPSMILDDSVKHSLTQGVDPAIDAKVKSADYPNMAYTSRPVKLLSNFKEHKGLSSARSFKPHYEAGYVFTNPGDRDSPRGLDKREPYPLCHNVDNQESSRQEVFWTKPSKSKLTDCSGMTSKPMNNKSHHNRKWSDLTDVSDTLLRSSTTMSQLNLLLSKPHLGDTISWSAYRKIICNQDLKKSTSIMRRSGTSKLLRPDEQTKPKKQVRFAPNRLVLEY